MVPPRHQYIAFSTILLAFTGAGCGGTSGAGGGTLTREAKLNGITCTLTIKSENDPELTWAVTDRVIATFSGHRVEVEKKQVRLDNKTKPLPKGVSAVTIDAEKGEITIRAGGKPLFGPSIK